MDAYRLAGVKVAGFLASAGVQSCGVFLLDLPPQAGASKEVCPSRYLAEHFSVAIKPKEL